MPGIEGFEKAFAAFAGGEPEWVLDRRRTAFASFREQGFPTLRDEAWRFTRTGVIQQRDFTPVSRYRANGLADHLGELTFDDADCHRVVVVDGHFAPDLSSVGRLPSGVRVQSLATAIGKKNEHVEEFLGHIAPFHRQPFVALNTAFLRDGVYIELDAGVSLERAIHVAFVSTGHGTMSHPRVLVVVGDNATMNIVETYTGTGEQTLCNAVVEFSCGRNATVNHCRVQHEKLDSIHLARQQAVLARDCRFSSENISIGAALARHDVGARLDGEGIDCRLDGLYLAGERQHVDNQTYILHARPHCHSFELYKGILAGHARGVFNGCIYVDQDAQKTDAKQENNCLLLSDAARINTNPRLEIFADDVRCTHGATVGQLDEDAVFYLQARGIDRTSARQMLIHAFAGEVLNRIEVAALREKLEVQLFWWLSNSVGAAQP